jgi:hypothetical protein
VQLYRYFASQSNESYCHNPLCCFSTSNTKVKRIFRYDSVRKLLDTPSYTLINFTKQSTSWEADSRLICQEIPYLLWNAKVHYHVHKNPPMVPILSQMNLVHILTPYVFKVHFSIILPSMLSSPKQIFLSGILRVCVYLSSLSCVLHVPPIWSSSI